MFGFPSLSKLLVLITVVVVVWYGFKLVGRLDAARKSNVKPRRRQDTLGVDTQLCHGLRHLCGARARRRL